MTQASRTVYTGQGPLTTAAIPAQMRGYPSWIVWRYKQRPGEKKPTKVPFVVGSDRQASTTDMLTWRPFDLALAAFEDGQGDGIGFVFSSGDPFCGIDLDGCRDPETGEIEAWAQKFIDAAGGYAEASPSGEGVHIIVRGELPEGTRHKVSRPSGGAIEAYSMRRFFTMTGRVIR